MKVAELSVDGAYVIENSPVIDERGSFQRVLCTKEIAETVRFIPTQTSISYNKNRNTLRGIHVSVFPYAEAKLVTCLSGGMIDIIVDLRPTSKTFKKYSKITLSGPDTSIFIPKGCGHGFLTKTDETSVLYQITPAYSEECQRVIRYNDPELNIDWEVKETDIIISEKDKNAPLLKDYIN